MVFRKGGNLRKTDKFWYEGQRVEIVNKYKLPWNHNK